MSVTLTSQLRVSQGLIESIWLLTKGREKQEMGGEGEEQDTQSGEDKWL